MGSGLVIDVKADVKAIVLPAIRKWTSGAAFSICVEEKYVPEGVIM